MKELLTFLKQALSNGEPSSKRLIAFLGAITIFVLTIANSTEDLVNATLIITCTAIGGVAVTNLFENKKPKE